MRLACLLACLALLASCRTTRVEGTMSEHALSAKFRLTIPNRNAIYTVNGTLKLVHGERLRLSFQMPLVRTEVARAELMPDTLLLIDRMDRRYACLSTEEQRHLFGKQADFARVERFLLQALRHKKDVVINVAELGIPMLDKGQIALSDFSDKPLSLSPTRVSARYSRVEALELLDYLIKMSEP